MDVCILYFSGTGNTWWASEKLAEELIVRGRSAECHSIEHLDKKEAGELIENSGIIIFGYPIYGSCMPEPIEKFIDDLEKVVKNKNTGVFCTQMKFSGDGAWYNHKKLEAKGFDIKWTFHFKLPNNICFRISPLPYSVSKDKISKILKKCEGKIQKAANNIIAEIPTYTGNGFGSLLLGLIQRPSFKAMIKRPFKSPYKVNYEKCVNCMRCIMICPEGNIKMTDGEFVFGSDCTLCMRCYNYCPTSAITAYGLSHNEKKKPYMGPEGFDPELITPKKELSDYIK